MGIDYKNDLFVADANTGSIYHFDLNENRTELDLQGLLEVKIANSIDEKIRLDALQFVIECSKHKMDVIMNPPVLKSNNTLNPFKRRRHSGADNTRYSDNSFTSNQKETKKISI